MIIKLEPVNDHNRNTVLALSVREDQPFVATNEVSLRQADEANAEKPGVARPFAIYADEKPVGFCMFVFDPEEGRKNTAAKQLPSWLRPAVPTIRKLLKNGALNQRGYTSRSCSAPLFS